MLEPGRSDVISMPAARSTRAAMQTDHQAYTDVPAPAPAGGPHAGRPRIALTDDQARSLVRQLDAINARHANNPRQHRPFLHDFVRAVHHATGRIYSAATYRKLLAAYAPGRTPSTPTIETEKNLLEHDLRRYSLPCEVKAGTPAGGLPSGQAPDGQLDAGAGSADLAQIQIIGLLHHLAARLGQLERAPAEHDRSSGLQAHNDYLRERLAAVEAELASARALAARMSATAREEAGLAAERARQLATMHATAEAQAAALARMAASIDGDRQFFAMQVDGVRGETRAVRERCAQLEQQLKDQEQQVETYRQIAFKGGAVR
jgi:hypothetical protein